jgi:hypothetical protein
MKSLIACQPKPQLATIALVTHVFYFNNMEEITKAIFT